MPENSPRHTYLVGFSGSGKSTVGPMLARRLERPFYDSDLVIAERMRLSIPEIFAGRGEDSFRQLEMEVIKRLASARTPSIIALGGGALLKRDVRSVVFRTGLVVYLQCSMREIEHRLAKKRDRPLLHGRKQPLRERIRALFDLRRPGYKQAHVTVSTTTGSAGQTTSEIVRRLRVMQWH